MCRWYHTYQLLSILQDTMDFPSIPAIGLFSCDPPPPPLSSPLPLCPVGFNLVGPESERGRERLHESLLGRVAVFSERVCVTVVCYVMQEVQDCLEDWAVSLSELSTMKTDLSQYILTDDVLLLQEQVEHLHCQWEELCLKVRYSKTCLPYASWFYIIVY